jgi:hypothetical protein
MTLKSPVRKVRIKKEEIAVIHVCTQAESIKHLVENNNKLSVIITGNGDPEKGLCRQVALVNERQHHVLEKLGEIDVSISLLISLLTEGFVKFLFRWIFVPYFVIKLFYHITCYTGIAFLPLNVWSWFWSLELIIFFITMFILCIVYIIKEKK